MKNTEINKLHNEKNEIGSEIEMKNVKISKLILEQKHLKQEITNLNQVINKNNNKISQYESSNSWKITKPLRKFTNIFRSNKE